MASAIKQGRKKPMGPLKQVMKRWKSMGLGRRSVSSRSDSDSDSDSGSQSGSTRRISSGFFAVYVCSQQKRFVIPRRFLNLPIFVSLVKKSEEEFGDQSDGGFVLPCEVGFFKGAWKVLEKDEQRWRLTCVSNVDLLVVGLNSASDGAMAGGVIQGETSDGFRAMMV